LASGFVTRFAPSPTGRLHRGHAFSALTAFEAARRAGGRFLLRIEDIDAARCRPQFEAAIFEDLRWLGLYWESPVRCQAEHLADYRAALARLQDLGVVYRCFRTRAEVLAQIARAPHGAPEQRPAEIFGPLAPAKEAALLAQDRPFAWRLCIREAFARLPAPLDFIEEGEGPKGESGRITIGPEMLEDIVVARKDVGVSYHLAVVVDDALQGITQVIRGHDLFDAAPVQRLLQALLALPAPVYRHHRLILRPDGKRFAKRDTAETLHELRARGVSAQDLKTQLGL
jgi:glutamyl-Q tRNA(Asp) synthetase